MAVLVERERKGEKWEKYSVLPCVASFAEKCRMSIKPCIL